MIADDLSLDPSSYTYTVGTDYRMFYQVFGDYLAGSTDCGSYGNNTGTWLESAPCYNFNNDVLGYKTLNGRTKLPKTYFDDGQLALADGSLLMFENSETNTNGLWISADLNGFKSPPNRWGYDLFTFELVDGELKAMGDLETKYYKSKEQLCSINGTSSTNGITCASFAVAETDYFDRIVKTVK